MPQHTPELNDERVLVLTPTGRDAQVATSILGEAGLHAEACTDLAALKASVAGGVGAVVIAFEALPAKPDEELSDLLSRQPPWSELPVILLTSASGDARHSERALEYFGAANVTLLERPFRTTTLTSVVQGSLRSRRRQYQVRDLLSQRERILDSERLARSDAEVANRMKDEFLAGLSHELRTPLNAILGWCQLLQMGSMAEEEVREGLDVIVRNARLQTQLIEDLLDVSRIISGKLRLDVQPVNVPEIVEAAVSSVQPSADAKKLHLQRIIDPRAGQVSGDPARLQQVIWNLLTNAIKFTPEGGKVQVRVSRVASHVEITVSDTGAGIAPEFLPYVFDRFRQADGSSTRRHGGLGLGLSIVRQLVALHSGAVRADSAGLGQGASFTVELPISLIRKEARGDGQRPATPICDEHLLKGLRVLVVDDDADARSLLERVLTEGGAAGFGAGSANEAIARVAGDSPDMLISDISMPERDGYDLIREVRQSGRDAKHLPAVALTAFARAEDRQRALLAGFQMHVAKPVNASELMAAIASLAGRTGTTGAPAS